MGTITVHEMTRREAREKLDALLRDVGMTPSELEERAKDYSLSEKEEAIWAQVEALIWLVEE